MNRYLLFFVSLFLTVSLFSQPYDEQVSQLDLYVQKAQADWKVPGLAIAVVKDGETLFTKGYGVQELGKPEPVDPQTLFAMASTTKAVTAAAMAMLADEGKIEWTDRVIDHLPEFQLKDPYVTREVRIKDLFTHNAGLGNADLLWYGLKLDSEEILRRMRHMEPAYSFRGGYRYQNLMYLVAGQVIQRVSGIAWEDFVADRIFGRLDMAHTFPTRQRSSSVANRAVAHSYYEGKIGPILDTDADMIGPAGSGWTCVEDMAKWMNFLLDSAQIADKRLISPENFSQLFRPQIIIPYERFYPSKRLTKPHWTTYGLGWFQHDYQGRAVSFHTGSLAGTTAICGLIPDERLGVYILGNLGYAELRHALMYYVFDLFGAHGISRDWSQAVRELYDSPEPDPKPVFTPGTKPDLPLKAYAGIYAHPLWGEVAVHLSDNHLVCRYGGFVFNLDHWQHNTFTGKPRPWDEDEYVSFHQHANGAIRLEVFGAMFEPYK